MSMRTDLAQEALEYVKSKDGIAKSTHFYDNCNMEVTEIEILSENTAQQIGKPIGKYITLENKQGCFSFYSQLFNEQAELLQNELLKLLKDKSNILVVGLGNRAITPDRLGPACAEKIFATRHIKRLATDIDTSDLSDVCVISPGVMAQTGMEASEIVRSTAGFVKPQAIIAVDALACSDLSHLGTTIQITNTGISPGSGVQNSRKELSEKTLGIPCVAVGVPTVADMNTVAEALEAQNCPDNLKTMLVTPKSIDNLVARTAALISTAINRAFHPTLSDEEITSLIL
ncbi:MAG: GPR endopeptidase [Oscillospiraceae bacterium]